MFNESIGEEAGLAILWIIYELELFWKQQPQKKQDGSTNGYSSPID